MNLVADECLHARIIAELRAAGHDVQAIHDLSPGAPDDEVMRLAHQLDRPLITEDLGFGERFFRMGSASAGVVLLRLPSTPIALKAQLLVAVLREHGDEIQGAFVTLNARTVRIRRRPRF